MVDSLTLVVEPSARPGDAVGRVVARGARPIALVDALGVGPRGAAGTVAGLSEEARRLGVPVVGGEWVCDPTRGDVLVTLACVGVGGDAGEMVAGVTDAEKRGDAAEPEGVPHAPAARPDWLDALTSRRAEDLPRAASDEELAGQVHTLAAAPNQADKRRVAHQFDRYLGGDTVLAQPEDAGLVRVGAGGIAVAVDSAARFARLDPYVGAQLALSESVRNVAACGAKPIATAHCLHVGPADDPTALWQADAMARGLADGARDLGLAVTDAHVRFHPAAGGPFGPVPVVVAAGVLDDVAARTPMGFAFEGDAVALLGETRAELSGSAWAEAIHDHLGGRPPTPNPAAERALASVLGAAARRRLLTSAHDLADGGLALALVEACRRHGLGASLQLPGGDPTVALFSESPARVLVSLSGEHYAAFAELCTEHGIPLARLGEVVDSGELEVVGRFRLGVSSGTGGAASSRAPARR